MNLAAVLFSSVWGRDSWPVSDQERLAPISRLMRKRHPRLRHGKIQHLTKPSEKSGGLFLCKKSPDTEA